MGFPSVSHKPAQPSKTSHSPSDRQDNRTLRASDVRYRTTTASSSPPWIPASLFQLVNPGTDKSISLAGFAFSGLAHMRWMGLGLPGYNKEDGYLVGKTKQGSHPEMRSFIE